MTLTEFLAKAGTLLGFVEKSLPDTAKLQADLTAALESISTLTAERDQLATSVTVLTNQLTTARTEHTSALTTLEADVERRAGIKAAEIAAQQGIPPLKEQSAENQGRSGKTLLEQYNEISDPRAKAAFYAEHRDQILK